MMAGRNTRKRFSNLKKFKDCKGVDLFKFGFNRGEETAFHSESAGLQVVYLKIIVKAAGKG